MSADLAVSLGGENAEQVFLAVPPNGPYDIAPMVCVLIHLHAHSKHHRQKEMRTCSHARNHARKHARTHARAHTHLKAPDSVFQLGLRQHFSHSAPSDMAQRPFPTVCVAWAMCVRAKIAGCPA